MNIQNMNDIRLGDRPILKIYSKNKIVWERPSLDMYSTIKQMSRWSETERLKFVKEFASAENQKLTYDIINWANDNQDKCKIIAGCIDGFGNNNSIVCKSESNRDYDVAFMIIGSYSNIDSSKYKGSISVTYSDFSAEYGFTDGTDATNLKHKLLDPINGKLIPYTTYSSILVDINKYNEKKTAIGKDFKFNMPLFPDMDIVEKYDGAVGYLKIKLK